jgi:hypothetical protein
MKSVFYISEDEAHKNVHKVPFLLEIKHRMFITNMDQPVIINATRSSTALLAIKPVVNIITTAIYQNNTVRGFLFSLTQCPYRIKSQSSLLSSGYLRAIPRA